jgi:UDP-glucose 4-epimerase
MENTMDIPRAMNLGNQSGVSVLDIIKIVKGNIDKNFSYNLVNGREGDPASIIADCALAQQYLNWSPNLSIEEMVISGWKAYEREKVLF